MSPAVFAFGVEIESVAGMFNGGDSIACVCQFRDQSFDQRGFATV
jgi:hypothetical protein